MRACIQLTYEVTLAKPDGKLRIHPAPAANELTPICKKYSSSSSDNLI